MILRTVSAVALVSLGACTFFAKDAPVAATGAVPIYDSTQIAFDRYTVLKRLGVGDWGTAFGTMTGLAGAVPGIGTVVGSRRVAADRVVARARGSA